MPEQKMPHIPLETTIAEIVGQSEESELDEYQQLMDSRPQGEAFAVEVQMKLHCDTPRHLQAATRMLGQAIGGNIEIGKTSIQITRQPSLKQQLDASAAQNPLHPRDSYNSVEIGRWLAKNIDSNVKFVHLLLGSMLLSEDVEWPDSSMLDKLTYREGQVLTLVFHGKSNAEIGQSLFLSGSTIKTHLRRIAKKLDIACGDRTFMATAYLRHLLLQALQGIEMPEEA